MRELLREVWGFVSTTNALAAVALTLSVLLLVLLLLMVVLTRRSRRAARRERARNEQVGEELRGRLAELERAHWQTQGHNVRLVQERDEFADQARRSREEGGEVLANLALRTLALVERQLGRLESLEETESDAVRLDELYQLDHLATRMRRNGENMLLLAGGGEQHRSARPGAPAPLLDVLRAALSEIERYERVHLTALPQLWLRPELVDDLSHLFAELLDNGTAFSPPTEAVTVSAWYLDSGELMVSVADRGIGMTEAMLRQANAQLADEHDPEGFGANSGRSLGLRVVMLLARRHGLRVQLRASAGGDGTTALVALPATVLTEPPAAPAAPFAHLPADPQAAHAGGQAAQPTRHQAPQQDASLTAFSRAGGPVLAAVPGARQSRPEAEERPVGLPKRVPGESGQLARSAEPGPGAARTDAGSTADELRRRLGGFQNGLRAAAAPREEDKA